MRPPYDGPLDSTSLARTPRSSMSVRAGRFVPQSVVAVSLAWTLLVLCRVGARVLSVGTGARTLGGLVAITASVNAYWLIAGPALAWSRRETRRWSRRDRHALLILAGLVVVLAEPVWYRYVLVAFNGTPQMWHDAVLMRGNVNVVIVALIYAAGWVTDAHTEAQARERQRNELESMLVDAELRALTLQLQPHFLFNTLQLAAEAAYDELATARRIVHDLQTLLRRTFELEERSLVSVASEIDFLQSYIAIQRRRFGSRLAVKLHVDSAAQDLMLPPLLLQPLVENSIRHGLGSLARDGEICITIERDAASLRLTVRDNGVGFSTTSTRAGSGGLGLGVTRRRLDALFPGRHELTTMNVPAGGAVVSIVLPAAELRPERMAAVPARGWPFSKIQLAWWSRSESLRAALGGGVIVSLLTGTMLSLDGSGWTGVPARPGEIAMWFPLEVVVFALAVVVWRGRRVRRWRDARAAEARDLGTQVDTARAQISALQAGRDLMVSALTRLTLARSASEFDQLVLNSSDLIRSVLALAKDGDSCVDLEAELGHRYFAVVSQD